MSRKLIYMLAVLCAACVEPSTKNNTYFDLNALLGYQAGHLSLGHYKLKETVLIEDKIEERISSPDSTAWQASFSLLHDFNLSEPSLVGAYEVDSSASQISYQLKPNQRAELHQFKVKTVGENQELSALIYSDKKFYGDQKKMTMKLQNGILQSFEVEGFHKMVMKDTVRYRIIGQVIKE